MNNDPQRELALVILVFITATAGVAVGEELAPYVMEALRLLGLVDG